MPPFRQTDIFRTCPRKQHGAALMVMLVIMIIGAATILVSSLASSAIKIERDKTTANALAQAKEALIGRALADVNRPGSLRCPDITDDGSSDSPPSGECYSYIGRLPWRTLGLPDLRDGSGERLWYVLSLNFRDASLYHINSDTQGTLTIGGTSSASSIIAIVFSPGAAINGTSRSPSATAACSTSGTTVAQSLCATNYLEGSNAALNTSTNLNTLYVSADTSSTFNDRIIFITHKDLMPLVEKRIAREVKGCLDAYGALPANADKYPWAAPVSSTTYTSIPGTLFGRPPTSTSSYGSSDQLMLDDITALLNALENYKANPSDPNSRAEVDAAATKLYNDADSYVVGAPGNELGIDSINNTKLYAGRAQDASKNNQSTLPLAGASAATVSSWVGNATSGEEGDIYKQLMKNHYNKDGLFLGTSTPFNWPPSCTIFSSYYWPDWRDLVFYQIASGYAPSASSPLSCGNPNTCLAITGSGNTVTGSGTYRAAVAVAGKMKPGQTSRNATLVSDYLELLNQTGKTDIPTNTSFETYKTFDAQYPTVNDLVLCVDGTSNCK